MAMRMATIIASSVVLFILIHQSQAYLPGRHAISPSVSVELMAGMVLLLICFLVLPAILALLCFCAYVKLQSHCSKPKPKISRFKLEFDEQKERLLYI